MSWISNYVRPKFRALVTRSDIPENLWEKCDSCGQMIFHRDLANNLRVCTHCGHHMRIGARKRLELLFDDGEYVAEPLPETVTDPLRFRDRKRYSERLRESRNKTEESEAIIVAHGTVNGYPLVVAAFNFAFMGGSMGVAVGESLVMAARLAVDKGAPLLAIPASGGARMQEGILSLMQMPRTTIAVDMVKEAGLPYLVLLTDPTTGGVTASFAMLGDINLAEPGATIGFAGARVIEETIRQKLPDGFQRAEYLRDHGMVDMVVDRREMGATLGQLIDLFQRREPRSTVIPLAEAADALPENPSLDETAAAGEERQAAE
ncbi:acetyl-CoA carboxylase carboxyltransferase subunit alpha [Limimonas halophila]|uniref:Acetyl-coenzyme A carboxylase carboxyl transferase subunit beta n=1 Tax=Limimonas halophila TaxID=1082479 RepID=A0A1G7T7E8_9PROT|nr:acetyl-CoA carboxylase, carboxyltransferase subunit beta [Limimonas halophila]SDG30540.1 acetyl-CoA carboxylase carboxyltransferase subunit alpha [Limimonas halophila]